MKNILMDKRYICLQFLSILFTVVYLILTNTYQHKAMLTFWAAALLTFVVCGGYSGVKRWWAAVAVNLSAVILIFISIIFLPYSV